jgi:anion-transporting  ArsA/GET3 family ATPase
MSAAVLDRRLLVVVGGGGVGKTTLAAALGLVSARAGTDTLVMTFDPSLRLKDALGVGGSARVEELPVTVDAPGALYASLLDARATFDGLVRRYAPDDAAAARIFGNRFYRHLAGGLAGVLEYMAVERLFEVARDEQVEPDQPIEPRGNAPAHRTEARWRTTCSSTRQPARRRTSAGRMPTSR